MDVPANSVHNRATAPLANNCAAPTTDSTHPPVKSKTLPAGVSPDILQIEDSPAVASERETLRDAYSGHSNEQEAAPPTPQARIEPDGLDLVG